jgi:hypothetical protein
MPVRFYFVVRLGGIVIPAAGRYDLRVSVDGVEAAQVPFPVTDAPEALTTTLATETPSHPPPEQA